MTKKTRSARVPIDVDNLLKLKWPEIDTSERWRRVWDFSAIKVDNWLGKPVNRNDKIKNFKNIKIK